MVAGNLQGVHARLGAHDKMAGLVVLAFHHMLHVPDDACILSYCCESLHLHHLSQIPWDK